MKINEILAENITKDYFNAKVKTEVIFDTILTPVIGEILTVIGRENKKLKINGEMKLLAKEFPMLKLNEENEKNNYRNCNADYLMCDNNTVYFVELKTTQKSISKFQMKNYLNYLANCENKRFADVSGRAFIDLLNHVSKTGYPHNDQGKKEKDDLKQLFEVIINYPKNDGKIPEGWEEDNTHAARAISYLKKEKATSSKKYIFTAGQMLDNMKDDKWWNCKQIKLLYLLHSEKQISKYLQKGIIFVTFREIVERAYAVSEEMEKKGLKNYWEWIVKILIQCGLV